FAVAYIANYFVALRGTAVAAGRGGDLRLHVHLLFISLFAASLHGALLGLLVNVWVWPVQLAIVLTAVLTTAFILPGCTMAFGTRAWTLGSGEQWRVFATWMVATSFLLRLVYITQIEL